MAKGKSMKKGEILNYFTEKLQIKKSVVKQFFDELFSVAVSEAKNGFVILGLGKIVLKDRKARMGRNPATGETIKIKAKKAVKFKVAKQLKVAILEKAGVKIEKKKQKKEEAK